MQMADVRTRGSNVCLRDGMDQASSGSSYLLLMGYGEKEDGDTEFGETGMGINRGGLRRRRQGDALYKTLK